MSVHISPGGTVRVTRQRKRPDAEQLDLLKEGSLLLQNYKPGARITVSGRVKSGDPSVSSYGTELSPKDAGNFDSFLLPAARYKFSRFDRALSLVSRFGFRFEQAWTVLEQARVARKAGDWYHRPKLAQNHFKAVLQSIGRKKAVNETDYLRQLVYSGAAQVPAGYEKLARFKNRILKAIESGDELETLYLAADIALEMGWVDAENPPDTSTPQGDEPPPDVTGDSEGESGAPPGETGDDPDPEQGGGDGESEQQDDPGAEPEQGGGQGSGDGQDEQDEQDEQDGQDGPSQQAQDMIDRAFEAENLTPDDVFKSEAPPDIAGPPIGQGAGGIGGGAVAEYDNPSALLEPFALHGRLKLMLGDFQGGAAGPEYANAGQVTARAWRVGVGDLRVFSAPLRTRGEIFVLVDMSGSMGWHGGGYSHGRASGSLALQVANAIMDQHPTAHVFAYSGGHTLNVLRLSPGTAPSRAGSNILGDSTPTGKAMLFAENYINGRLAGASAVVITDGAASDPEVVTATARRFYQGGMRFGCVLVGRNAPTGQFPADAEVCVESLDDIDRVRDIFEFLAAR